MIVSLVLSSLLSLFIGYFFICLFLPRSGRDLFLVKGSLAVGLGIGISSCVFFLWLSVAGPLTIKPVLTEALFLIGIVLINKLRKKNHQQKSSSFSEQAVPKIIPISFVIATIGTIISFLLISLKNPHGGWDAWASWNMWARYIFRGGHLWREALYNLSHDHPLPFPIQKPPLSLHIHPLLLPMSVARYWKYLNHETLAAPILISFLFTFATVGLISSALSLIKSKVHGLLAGLVLLGSPFFIQHGASQYADVPFGFFLLSTFVLIALQERFSDVNPNLLFLTGITVGLSLLTKNEGGMFLISVIISYLVVSLKDKQKFYKKMFFFATGLLPILGVTLYYKAQINISTHLLSSLKSEIVMERVTNLHRYLSVGKAFVEHMIRFNGWSLLFVAVFLFLWGAKIKENQKKTIAVLSIVLIVLLIEYFLFHVAFIYDLQHYIRFGLDRLLLHLWPSFVFTLFLTAGNPEPAAAVKTS